ncbi:hypothetical protein GTW66_12600 [Streptomyces sp. SID5473]|nr:hypothetical protein [Streptomyces sp. SID5473]EIF88260.1 hypothetical protein [Streptomyces tsukubensis NRRL18488]MYS64882.1 hypothetical protein [Streptomyces sp. SID5473]
MQNIPRDEKTPVDQVLTALALAGAAALLWAVWLGWDQQRDVQPDGSETGPYQAWQVIRLVVTLPAPVYWAASRRYVKATVFGITAGLTGAACYDWSDHASGLFAIGVAMIMMGSPGVTGLVAAAVASRARRTGRAAGSAGGPAVR